MKKKGALVAELVQFVHSKASFSNNVFIELPHYLAPSRKCMKKAPACATANVNCNSLMCAGRYVRNCCCINFASQVVTCAVKVILSVTSCAAKLAQFFKMQVGRCADDCCRFGWLHKFSYRFTLVHVKSLQPWSWAIHRRTTISCSLPKLGGWKRHLSLALPPVVKDVEVFA